MSSSVTLAQIVENITRLSTAVKPAEFIYEFLTCFGLPKATIARLKGAGGVNLAKKEGCTLLKTKVYFEPLRADLLKAATPMQAIEAAQKDARIAANKPRFLIATDFKTLAAFDTKRRDTVEFPIGDLHEHYTFFLPLAGMEKSTVHAEAEADVKAAENMAKLYDLIRADNPPKTREERHALNVFLTRLLFCYFAEDTAIFPNKAFTGAVESYTQPDGSDLDAFLKQLFITLNTEAKARGKTPRHLADFPYVNGGLFSDTHSRQSDVPSFSTKSRQKLIELGTKSWREINPDIFGSMFQGVVDDEKRAELGMHYTSVPNIIKVIRPLFLDELYAEFEKAKGSEAKLNKLLSRIYRLRIFDPACGSGNFLIIAYKELRWLEMLVFQELQRMAVQLPLSLSGIQVSQFYGIELDDFAHEVAILALWLAEHQMNIEFEAVFGKAPASLPLKDGAKIVRGDATLLDWGVVCPAERGYEIFVIGNPPYSGARKQTAEQKESVRRCYGNAPEHKDADLISCWFLKGASMLRDETTRLAFVTTNSICQGDHVAILWPRITMVGVEIAFTYPSFKWTNNAKGAAAVTCAIIGLRRRSSGEKWIYAEGLKVQVKNINAYLANAADIIIEKRRTPISERPEAVMGSMARDGGHLILEREERDQLLSAHPEARPLVRYLSGADEFVKCKPRWCLWIANNQLPLALSIPPIAARIRLVEKFRNDSSAHTTNGYAAIPHQFAQRAHEEGHSFIIPSVSPERRKYLPIGLLDSNTIITNLALTIYNADLWILGLISSWMHMVWVRAVAGRLGGEGVRYSTTICYNNFPFPQVSTAQTAQLARLAEALLASREQFPGKNLAYLYDPDTMPEEVLAAHRALDEAVERCYRVKPFTSDDERLEYLFALYEQVTAAEAGELFASPASTKAKAKAKKS
jgi:hypothetical protein